MSKTLARGLNVLELLADADEGIGLSELARAARMDKATVFRMVETLAARGYVARCEGSTKYELTVRLWELGHRVIARRDISRVARPFLRRLAEQTGETAYLAVPDGFDAVYIDKFDSANAVRTFMPIGGRMPLYCGSTGKVLLAFQTDDRFEAVARKLKPVTRFTITSRARLLREIRQVRRRGFALNQNEFRLGISGVAGPVRDGTGNVVASFGITGPSERMPLEKLERLGPIVVAIADEASTELGYRALRQSPPGIAGRQRTH